MPTCSSDSTSSTEIMKSEHEGSGVKEGTRNIDCWENVNYFKVRRLIVTTLNWREGDCMKSMQWQLATWRAVNTHRLGYTNQSVNVV